MLLLDHIWSWYSQSININISYYNLCVVENEPIYFWVNKNQCISQSQFRQQRLIMSTIKQVLVVWLLHCAAHFAMAHVQFSQMCSAISWPRTNHTAIFQVYVRDFAPFAVVNRTHACGIDIWLITTIAEILNIHININTVEHTFGSNGKRSERYRQSHSTRNIHEMLWNKWNDRIKQIFPIKTIMMYILYVAQVKSGTCQNGRWRKFIV